MDVEATNAYRPKRRDQVARSSVEDDTPVRGGTITTRVIAVDVEAGSAIDFGSLFRLEEEADRPEPFVGSGSFDMPKTNWYWPKSLFVDEERFVNIARRARVATRQNNIAVLTTSKNESSSRDLENETKQSRIEVDIRSHP